MESDMSSMPESMAEKGTFGPRFVAYFIDAIIVGIITGLLWFVGRLLGGDSGVLLMLMQLLAVVIGVGYYVYFWGTSGATPGKKTMGLRVVSTDGQPMTMGKAFIRYIGYIISAIVFYLGFIWIAIDKDKQGWHDKIANTYVIKS